MSALALAEGIALGVIVEHPPVRVLLSDACLVTVKPYEVGDDIHMVIECRDGTLQSVLGDVEIDGEVHLKTDRESFLRMVATAKRLGAVPKLKMLLSGVVRRGEPILR